MSKEKVLIIEDDIDLLDIEKMQLQNAGYDVSTAQGAIDAIEILKKELFDCVLLDMNLSGSSGKDVIIATKKIENINYNTPIIIVSGDLNIELVREVREKISSILVKPFSSSELAEKIKSTLNKAHLTRVTKKIGQSKRVFIVDDDKDYVNELKNFLEAEKFQVTTSNNSQDAALKLQNQKFDIVLADLDIDHRSGEWLVNLLRRDSSHINNKTPVIIVSGFVNIGSPKLKEMVQNVVEKPISLIQLTQTIRNHLQNAPKPIIKSV